MLPGFSCYKQQQFAGFFLYALNECQKYFIIFLIIKGLFLCHRILATHKRVYKLFQTHLIRYLTFIQLMINVLLYLLFVSSHCINVISSVQKC